MNYPAWLGAGLLNGFDWSVGASSTMPRFLDEYTLHDSSWIGLWGEPGFETTILIGWDTHWSRGRLPYPIEGAPSGYPYLLIQFERLWLQRAWFEGDEIAAIIGGAISRALGDEEKHLIVTPRPEPRPDKGRGRTSKYLQAEHLFHTVLSPVAGGDVELWHGGATRFLCLDGAGQVLPIPDL